jgi:titin
LLETVSIDTESYQDTGLNGGSEYCYQVRAVNGGGHSSFTEVACATTVTYLFYFPMVIKCY